MFVSLLIPIGASATAGLSKVLITDPSNTTQQAHVDSSGNLQVGGTVDIGNSPTVSVGNTPTVSAQQSGSWNVGISGTPAVGIDPSANAVNVGNSASSPARTSAVDGPGRQRYAQERVIDIPGGSPGCICTALSVPAGKLLIIRQVSAWMQLPTGQHALYADIFMNFSQGGDGDFFIPLQYTGTSFSEDYFVANQEVEIEVPAGTNNFDSVPYGTPPRAQRAPS